MTSNADFALNNNRNGTYILISKPSIIHPYSIKAQQMGDHLVYSKAKMQCIFFPLCFNSLFRSKIFQVQANRLYLLNYLSLFSNCQQRYIICKNCIHHVSIPSSFPSPRSFQCCLLSSILRQLVRMLVYQLCSFLQCLYKSAHAISIFQKYKLCEHHSVSKILLCCFQCKVH